MVVLECLAVTHWLSGSSCLSVALARGKGQAAYGTLETSI
jgi:hypothetical protein